jgi:hypothetical protein
MLQCRVSHDFYKWHRGRAVRGQYLPSVTANLAFFLHDVNPAFP